MKTTIEITEGNALVTFEGVMDSYILNDVTETLEPLNELKNTDITLDCTKLEYIASSGLRMFLMLMRDGRERDCKVFIKGANQFLMDIFKSTGIVNCFYFID